MGHHYVGTEHLLLGLLREGTGVAATALQKLGVEVNKARYVVEKIVQTGEPLSTGRQVTFTPRARRIIRELAPEEATRQGHKFVRTEHLLLGILREEDCVAAQVLLDLDVDLDEVEECVMELQGPAAEEEEESGGKPRSREKSKTPALDSFGRDLTKQARSGELDPVIGREKEIERVMQVLCRRKKNNPVLLGEAGVGKTAIVEGLAQDIVSNNVPALLQDGASLCSIWH